MKKIFNIIILLLLLLSIVGNVLLFKSNSKKNKLIKATYGINYNQYYAKSIIKINFDYDDIKFHKDFSKNFKDIIKEKFAQEAYSQHGLDIEQLYIEPNNQEKTEYIFTIYGANKDLIKDQMEYITTSFANYINSLQEEISEKSIFLIDKSANFENQWLAIPSLKSSESILYYTNEKNLYNEVVADFVQDDKEILCRKKIKSIELIKTDYEKIK